MQVLWALEHDSQHVLPSGHKSRLGVSLSMSPCTMYLSLSPSAAEDARHSTQARQHVVQQLQKTIKTKTNDLRKDLVMMDAAESPVRSSLHSNL